jgi:branched-chain amino acid transport system ATP-binding protein
MAGALLEVQGLSKRFGGFVALDGIDLAVAEGERVGSWPERLRQVHAGQLHLRHAGQRDRHGAFDGAAVDGCSPTSVPPRHGAFFPAAAPVHDADRSAEPAGADALCRQCAARDQHGREIDARCVAAGAGGARRQGGQHPRDLTQVEMRKLSWRAPWLRAEAALIADESMAGLSQSEVDDIVNLLIALNERGITIIMIEHIMRAVMKFAAAGGAGLGKKIADGKPT